MVPVKKAAAFGQDDLFADLTEQTGERAFSFQMQISDTEWPRKQLLSSEREMLGLYVSAHPLDGAEHILSNHRDVTIAELLGSGRTGGEVQLAGLITGLTRKQTKQGNAWAIVELADRDGSIEVLFFPASYQLVQHALVEDAVVAIRGKVEDRDGTLQIFGQKLEVLDVSAAEHGGRPRLCGCCFPYRRRSTRRQSRRSSASSAPTPAKHLCTSTYAAPGRPPCTHSRPL